MMDIICSTVVATDILSCGSMTTAVLRHIECMYVWCRQDDTQQFSHNKADVSKRQIVTGK